jgi:hypothetical protein
MAAVNTIAFDQASYNVGDTITATVDFTPDTPSTISTPFTFTAQVTDAGGNAVGSPMSSTFNVNSTQAGDTCAVSDSGSRTWTVGAETVEADSSISQAFTATA